MRVSITNRLVDYGRIGWMYAYKNGHAVLKEDTSWRLISGFFITWGHHRMWVRFR